jgi:hypothetical protein
VKAHEIFRVINLSNEPVYHRDFVLPDNVRKIGKALFKVTGLEYTIIYNKCNLLCVFHILIC